MRYSLYGSLAAVLLVFGVAARSMMDRTTNYKAAKASVFMIDRTCNFVETTYEGGHRTATGVTDSCNSTDEWTSVRKKRNKVVSGKAVVHLTYVAPQDGSSNTGELTFDGRDDEFYDLKAGDEIGILVRNDDPTKISKS